MYRTMSTVGKHNWSFLPKWNVRAEILMITHIEKANETFKMCLPGLIKYILNLSTSSLEHQGLVFKLFVLSMTPNGGLFFAHCPVNE